MKKLLTSFLFLSLFMTFQAQAQTGLAVALKGGYGTGAYQPTRVGISLGKFAFRADVSYSFMPILDAYIAYSRTGFACGEDAGGFCNEGAVQFTTSGFNIGLRLNRGPVASVWIPWLRVGLAYKSLEWTQNNQDYSDSGLGFEIGAGLAYPITGRIKIVPAVNYTRYTITGANGDDNPTVVITGLIGARFEF